MTYVGASLSLTPWAAQALSTEDRARISRRLVDLHMRLYAGYAKRSWTIKAESWDHTQRDDAYDLVGNLAFHIDGFLDAWEKRFCRKPTFSRDPFGGMSHAAYRQLVARGGQQAWTAADVERLKGRVRA